MEYCPSCFSRNLPLPLFTMVKSTHGVFLRHWRPIDHWITLQCFGYPVSIIFKYATWSLLVLTKYYYYVITLWGQAVYAVLHSQIGLRDAGGLLSCITAASCSALLSNSLSCLIIAADKHMCTGTAPPTWTLFFFFFYFTCHMHFCWKYAAVHCFYLFVLFLLCAAISSYSNQPTIISCQSYISPRQMRIIPQTSANLSDLASQVKDFIVGQFFLFFIISIRTYIMTFFSECLQSASHFLHS